MIKKIVKSEIFIVAVISLVVLIFFIVKDINNEKQFKEQFLNSDNKETKVEKVIEYVEVEKTIIVTVTPTPKPTKKPSATSKKTTAPKTTATPKKTSSIISMRYQFRS
jgi:hypothetical protein